MGLCVFCSGSGAVGPFLGSEHLFDSLVTGDKSVDSIDSQIDPLASCVYLGVT